MMMRRPLRTGVLALATLLGLTGSTRAADPLAAAPTPVAGTPAAAAPSDNEAPSAASFVKDVVPFLSKHCYSCHGRGKRRADLALDEFLDEKAIQEDRDLWEVVLDMVRSGEMPPKPRPRPNNAETEDALEAFEAVLARLDCSGPRNAGRVTLRRLNRTEYNNTIRDLVGVDFKPAADFPNDDVGYGFDNIGDVLSLSPLLLEKYLVAAEAILERAIVIADPAVPVQNRLGSFRTSFGAGGMRGRGMYLHSRGSISVQNFFEEGDYTFRVETYGQQLGDEPVRAAFRLDDAEIQEFAVPGDRSNPTKTEVKVRLKTGTTRVGVAFLNPTGEGGRGTGELPPEELANRRLLFLRGIEVDGPYNAPPPVLPEVHQKLMAHTPGLPPREAAREILTRFATRAFRRPAKPEEVERFLKLYDQAEREGDRFEDRIRLALEGILVWPPYLFRVELDPPGATAGASYLINEYELASRLSYFLWSSTPDDELMALAGQRRLRQNLDA